MKLRYGTLAIILISLMIGGVAAALPIQINSTGRISGGTVIPDYFLGFSGYVTSTSNLQQAINLMNGAGMTMYRISFRPSWLNPDGSYHGYNTVYIDYLLAHSNFFVIVDGTHLYPPQESSAQDARNHWDLVRARCFQVLERYGNNPRVAVELINEYVSSDYNTQMQGLINDIRNAGYTNAIVVNKWNTAWHKFTDPLDNTYQGYHFYFNSWSVSGAENSMIDAQNRGIKLINTEIGASYNEASDYTQTTVNEVSQFLQWCASRGISNCLWQNNDYSNWATYVRYNLAFPTPPQPSW